MQIQRSIRDVYALCLPQSGEDEFEDGDVVEIHNRADRIEEYGWVRREGDIFTLTEEGAAIINKFNEQQKSGELLDSLEDGAGRFADDAIEEKTHEHDYGDWSPEEMKEDSVVMSRECTICGRTDRKKFD